MSARHTLGPARTGRCLAPGAQRTARHRCQWHNQHQRCVGCENQSRGTRSGTIKPRVKARGNRRRRDRRKGAGTATEWRSLPKELRAAVRSTLPEATAVAPAVMRTPEQGGKRKPVTGEGRTGDAQAADMLGQVSGVAVGSSPVGGQGWMSEGGETTRREWRRAGREAGCSRRVVGWGQAKRAGSASDRRGEG